MSLTHESTLSDAQHVLLKRIEEKLGFAASLTGLDVDIRIRENAGHADIEAQRDGIYVYPVRDGGGQVVADIVCTGGRGGVYVESETVVTETAYAAIAAPLPGATDDADAYYRVVGRRDGVVIFDDEGRILYANESAAVTADVLGLDRRLVGMSIYGSVLSRAAIRDAIESRRPYSAEDRYGDIVIEVTMIPVTTGGKVRRVILVLRDRTEMRRSERELLVKNSVIKEIHHRVKNNLQTVAGFLRLQARLTHSEDAKRALHEGVGRIESMALVHDIVSHYEDDYIFLRALSERLMRLTAQSASPPGVTVETEYTGTDVLLDSRRAGYVSLILNELVTNALKYGAVDTVSGTMRITAEADVSDGRARLVLTNAGRGGREVPVSETGSGGLGLEIVKNLVANELNGEFSYAEMQNGDVRVSFTFETE